MQISRIELSNLKQLLKKIDNTNEIDVFYVADSLGALDKKESVKIAKLLKNFKKPFGIHAHDNLGKALSNTLTFINHGATWADSTMLGMGRGPGNVDTIKLLKKLRNLRNIKLLKKSITNFVNLKSKYQWGKNIYYALAAKKGIHPSYIQEILNFKDYTKAQVLSTINSLSKINAYSFSESILESACFQKNLKPINISILKKINLKKKSALVLGSDNDLLLHSDEINFLIKKKNPLVLSLNFNKKKF
jgi:4-hydroxy 2-oxovalerate aldolase